MVNKALKWPLYRNPKAYSTCIILPGPAICPSLFSEFQSWILLELWSLEVRLFRWLVCLRIGGHRRMATYFIPLFQSYRRASSDWNSSRIQDCILVGLDDFWNNTPNIFLSWCWLHIVMLGVMATCIVCMVVASDVQYKFFRLLQKPTAVAPW